MRKGAFIHMRHFNLYRRCTAALLTAALFAAAPAARALSCPDVAEGAWYAADVGYVTERQVMDCDADGTFRPGDNAMRGEIVEALWHAAGKPASEAEPVFTDTDPDAESGALRWAYETGVATGYSDGRFGGDESVTREQFAAMLWRAAGKPAAKRDVNFADRAAVSSYARTAVAWARENGLVSGVGGNRFAPTDPVTRAQTAAVLARSLRLADTEIPPLTGCVICVDPGHCVTPLAGKGYRQPVSPLSNETKALYSTGTQGAHMTEEKLNLTVGLKLRDRLTALGATVLMTRTVSKITISGLERCAVANDARADVTVSIHADGSTDKRVHGVSVLVPDGNLLGTPSIKAESVRLGKLMVNAVAAETGAKNRGTIARSDLTGFNFSEVPAVLIEMGYMTNAAEDALLETDAYQNKIVNGMVNSLLQWYGVN